MELNWSWSGEILKLTTKQQKYIYWLTKTFKIKDAEGIFRKYEPLNWQIEYHASCMIANDKKNTKDRFTRKSRKVGWTLVECMDILSCAIAFPQTDFPISSITERTGTNPITWIKELCDNADIPFVESSDPVPIDRNQLLKSYVMLDNYSRIFDCPGGNPDAIRGFLTPKCVNDEWGRTPYQLASELWDASRGTMSGFWTQHDVGSTMPKEPTHEFNIKFEQVRDMNFIVFDLPMFPIKTLTSEAGKTSISFFDKNEDFMSQIDQEYLDAYPDDQKTMKKLCNEAWDAGMWKIQEPIEGCEHQKFWGVWPEDRGLIPLCWWWNLSKRADSFAGNLEGSMREYMCSTSAGTGSYLSEDLINKIAVIPIRHKFPNLWAYELDGDMTFRYWTGWDFASKRHKACVTIFRESIHSLDMVYCRLMDKMATPDQVELFLELLIKFPSMAGAGIDSTGPGIGFFEDLVKLYHQGRIRINLVEFIMNRNVIDEYYKGEKIEWSMRWSSAANFKRMAEAEGIRILNNQDIKRDFLMPNEGNLKSGIDAKTGSHADIATAGFIACKTPYLVEPDRPHLVKGKKLDTEYIDPREKALAMVEGRVPLSSYKSRMYLVNSRKV